MTPSPHHQPTAHQPTVHDVHHSAIHRQVRTAAATDGPVDHAHRPVDHVVEGVVVRGAELSARLGFPTARLATTAALPDDGAYAATVQVDPGAYGPTFVAVAFVSEPVGDGPAGRELQAHLLGFAGDLDGVTLRVELCAWLRPMLGFDDPAALVRQLHLDAQGVRAWATRHDLGPLLTTDRPTPARWRAQRDSPLPGGAEPLTADGSLSRVRRNPGATETPPGRNRHRGR